MAEWLSNLVQQLSPREESRSSLASPTSSRKLPSPASTARVDTVSSPSQKTSSPIMASPVAKAQTSKTLVPSETPTLEAQFQSHVKNLLPEQSNILPSSDGEHPTPGGESRKEDADVKPSSTVAVKKSGAGGVVSGVEGVTGTTDTANSETLVGSPKIAADTTQDADPAVSSGARGSAVTTNGSSKVESGGSSGGNRGTEEGHTKTSPKISSTTDRAKGPASPTKRRSLPVFPVARGEADNTNTGVNRQDEKNTSQSKHQGPSVANDHQLSSSSSTEVAAASSVKRGSGSGSNQRTSDTGKSPLEDSHSTIARGKSAPQRSGNGGPSPKELTPRGSQLESTSSRNVSSPIAALPEEPVMPLPVASMVGGELAAMISSTRACVYEATEFFVAWQGVLTVAYSGIPPALCELKDRMGATLSSMVPENPGSRWPKTTLACLRDDQRLTPEQLSTLRDICSTMSFQLALSPPVLVDTLSVVLYENCCLEKQLSATHIPLQHPIDPAPPSLEQRQYVRGVVDEFGVKNLAKYWLHASKDGNRSSHYRKPKMGATVVRFLAPHEVPSALSVFRRLVDAALPGIYDWFADDSLHITLRALC